MAGALVLAIGLLSPAPAQAQSAQTSEAESTHASESAQAPSAYDEKTAEEREALRWHERISKLRLEIEAGRKTHADADRLYAELSGELWPMVAGLRSAITEDALDPFSRHAELTSLYADRSALFELLSPSLQGKLTGLDALGRDELRREVGYVSAILEFQRTILRSGLRRAGSRMIDAPTNVLRGLFDLAIAILVFVGWRRWARRALPAWRKSLLAARPRRRSNLRLAKLLWYVERIRRPVEWLALVWVITLLLRPAPFDEISTLISTVVKWLLIGTLAVRVIDAMVARGAAGLRKNHAALRLRSLRVAGAWAIVLGLGLDLTARYAGTAVIYMWIVRGWIVLTLPVVLLLVHWWRPVIFEELSEHARYSTTATRIGRHARGLGSYAAAAAGGGFLLVDGFMRFLVRVLSGSEVGRRLIAVLVRREVAREMERDQLSSEEPIADEIVLPLVAARHVIIEEYAKRELNQLVASVKTHGGGGSIVTGERGSGKAIFLERLSTALEGSMRLIDCPLGGWRAFEQTLGEAFEVEPGDDFARRLGEAIERQGVHAIGVDNFHLLPRPTRGGQAALIELTALNEHLGVPVSWVFAVDRHAWHYILRAGADRAMLHEVISLPPWTEEQLAELVERRAQAIDIQPDYGRLVLPRQLDLGEHDDPDARNRFGYARVLWELSDGNPAVALYLFAESLRREPDGSIILRLPQLRSASSLTDAHPDALLVLRALIQCDVATVEDVARSVRLSIERVTTILAFCVRNQWVTIEGEGYRVSWRWFRSVTRALARKNLMGR